jgi:hypothetical protein
MFLKVVTALTVSFMAAAAQAGEATGPRTYVVQMDGESVVAFQGGVAGLAATRPARGAKVDRNHPDVAAYVKHLDERSAAALRAAGGGSKLYNYRFSIHGFAAMLTPAQAEKLKSMPGVVAVEPDEVRQLDTISTPDFLGLTGRGGLWSEVGGYREAGEDVVVGMVDSGIWPESPSFAGRGFDDDYSEFRAWLGQCVPGEAFPVTACNNKLIGARYYNAGLGGPAKVKALFPYEYNSARDADGHGTHTSSTAAGNHGVTAIWDGVDLGKMSGMAPRARLAAYKVCWGRFGDVGTGCYTSDLLAAIDDAIADGVDVINYSISGSQSSFVDPVEIAFLSAADAGVFVAASAGNSGPTASTAAHNSPWVTSVAAGTHDRTYIATATLGSGASFTGPSLSTGTPSLPVVLSSAAGLLGKPASDVARCVLGALDPVVVAGKIVVCDRGGNVLVDKSQAVKDAGGLGMLLVNVSGGNQSQLVIAHSIPAVHLSTADGVAIKTYVTGTSGPTARIGTMVATKQVAPAVADFSSRGPSRASGDILKPDVMAPGQDILAAVSPVNGGRNVDFYSGTSMSSPHVAGIAAVLKGKHRDWSPAMIRSALVTTASRTTNAGTPIAGGFFAHGAGEVVPTAAFDPGLVFDAGFDDYWAFLCANGNVNPAYCPAVVIPRSNLNQPSIAVSSLTGVRTVTRTVTNVSGEKETYSCSASVPGFTATVSPDSFTIKKDRTQTLAVTFARGTAPFGAYAQGLLTCTGNRGHVVKSPVALRPLVLSAPTEVASTGGPLTYPVTFGFAGPFTASPAGLVPATTFDGSVMTGDFALFEVVVPAGNLLTRFSLFDETTTPGSDLDLYVFDSNFNQIGGSGGSTSAEQVDLRNLPAGTYYAYIDGFATADPSTFRLFTWAVGADTGNMTVTAPATVTLGASASVGLSFTGLVPATRYLGSVVYGGGAASATPTVVRVNTP